MDHGHGSRSRITVTDHGHGLPTFRRLPAGRRPIANILQESAAVRQLQPAAAAGGLPMKRFKDVEHLVRLAVLFAGGVLAFGVARAAFVPATFGELGHYRASAVNEARVKTPVYAGQQACADCHADVVDLRAKARHKAIACESCHGPLAKHAEGSSAETPKKPDAGPLCARCHAANTGKSKRYPIVDIKEHAGTEPCLTCHTPHNPRIE
jgi:hypothetical protein